jgi:hypothetical protein
MDKVIAGTQADFEKAFADGTLVGYGDDMTLMHHEDGYTNDNWWSSMSLGGLIKVLEQVRRSANPTAPPLSTATKHWDNIYVSRLQLEKRFQEGSTPSSLPINWRRTRLTPWINPAKIWSCRSWKWTQAVHTEAFYIVYIGATADPDKVNAAMRESLKANPLGGPAFASMVESSQHRDEVARTNATYK